MFITLYQWFHWLRPSPPLFPLCLCGVVVRGPSVFFSCLSLLFHHSLFVCVGVVAVALLFVVVFLNRSHSLIMYLPCMVTKRERRCVGTCPYSDFDDFGAFSTWMDLATILDCVRLGANFTWNRYECLLSVFFLSFSSPSFVLLTVSIVASRLTQHKFPIFVADDLSSTSQCLRHFQNIKVH